MLVARALSAGFVGLVLESWQGVRADDSQTISAEQQQLELGSGLLAIIAIASIAVLVGGRMAERACRVGLLKAVGSTPCLIAVLLAENLLLAIAATILGVAIGRLVAPVLTRRSDHSRPTAV
jgi:putative ABC transport system permease protein